MSDCKICSKQHELDPLFVMEKGCFAVYHAPAEKGLIGYLYVEPKRHVESWSELNVDEKEQLTGLIAELERKLYEQIRAERVYTLSVGESVRHLHIHLIPRVAGALTDGLELIRLTAGPLGTGLKVNEGEIESFIAEFRR